MHAVETIKVMMQNAGFSVRGLGIAMGKTANYMNNTFYRGSVLNTNTYASIADACGYDLIVRKRSDGSVITIDPVG